MYCLDTNILIDLFRGEKEVISKISYLDNSEIFITPVTLCELFKGINLSSKKDKEIEEIRGLINFFRVLDFNLDIAEEFGRQYVRLSKAGKMIPEFDILIASFVKVNNLTLITKDKHFENLGVRAEVW